MKVENGKGTWALVLAPTLIFLVLILVIDSILGLGEVSNAFKRFANAFLTAYTLTAGALFGAMFFYADSRNRPLAPLFGMLTATLVGAGIIFLFLSQSDLLMEQSSSMQAQFFSNIVHLAVVMVALGVLGTSFFSEQRDVVLAPGESVVVNEYELRYMGTIENPKSNRTEFRSTVEVYRDGQLSYILHPQRAFYPNFNMAATRAAIRSTPVEDLFVVPSENLPDGSVGFRILVNPLIWWMWVAGPVLILGTLVSLWPQKVRTTVPAPSRAVRTATAPGTRGPATV